MKLVLAQMNIIWEDKKNNLLKLESALTMVKADLILFPEMSLTGFSMQTELTAEEDEASLQAVKTLAKKYETNIGFGWVKQTDKLCENHYSIVKGDGTVALDYIKLHPFSYSGEDKHFQGGDYVSITNVADFHVGCAICYDLRFPEVFRAMTPEADMILVPANWPGSRRAHWNALLTARAIENRCYVAGVNCCGDMGGQYYSGDSCLVAPDGTYVEPAEILTFPNPCVEEMYGTCKEERLMLYDIKNDVEALRDTFPVLKDRRDKKQFLIKS